MISCISPKTPLSHAFAIILGIYMYVYICVWQAVGLIGMTAYLSYLIGDYLGMSGIVCLFCCAVTMSHYAMPNISKQQRAATVSAFETLSFLSEGSIFVYVGLDALDPQKWEVRCSLSRSLFITSCFWVFY